MRLTRSIAATFALILSGGVALAAASSVPANYQPDPALKTASAAELTARIRKSCTVVQARLQSVAETSLSGPCGCYATSTFRALDAAEVQAYRDTGVFNDSARAKALAVIDSCKLQRPA